MIAEGESRTSSYIRPVRPARLTALTDLLAEPEPDHEWVWDQRLIAGGISIAAAKPKVGKSTHARNLALDVAQGAPHLGTPTKQGVVAYLALEEKRTKVAAHFRQMGATDEPVVIHVGAAPQDGLAWLRSVIAEHTPILTIVDPIGRLIRARDWNDYAEVNRALEPLVELARTSKCHILGTHHMGKLDREGGDGFLGSTALFGAVDTALIFKRNAEGARVLESVQRYGTDLEPTVLSLDPRTGRLAAAGHVADLLEEETAKKLLGLGAEELDEKTIRERVPGNLTPKVLRVLVSAGGITRTGSGKARDPYRYCPVPEFSYRSYRSYLQGIRERAIAAPPC